MVTDLWSGGRAQLRSGRYTYFATRMWQYSEWTWPPPVEQRDAHTWQSPNQGSYGTITINPGVAGWPTIVQPFAAPPSSGEPSLLEKVIEPWSTDPAVLATQLAAWSWDPNGPRPTYMLRAISLLYRTALPTPAQHAAALTVLCTTPGVRLLGATVDRVGRPGIAVTAGHSKTQRATLILDPETWRPQSLTTTAPGHRGTDPEDRTIVLLAAGYHDVIA